MKEDATYSKGIIPVAAQHHIRDDRARFGGLAIVLHRVRVVDRGPFPFGSKTHQIFMLDKGDTHGE